MFYATRTLAVTMLSIGTSLAVAQSTTYGPGEQIAGALPAPFSTKSAVKHPKVIGWPADKMPQAAAGLQVAAFVRELENPRWIYVLPNGDVLVAQSRTGDSPNKITLLRDENGDGKPEVQETFLEGLNQPFGMALVGQTLLVANTDAVLAFPYKEGQTKIDAPGMKILDLPVGGYNNHWTRNIIANHDGSKLYVTVGSASNNAEHGTGEELLRANILQCNLDGTALRVFASGVRNPNGLAWAPGTNELWTTVNERDELGDELVPDYVTSVQEDGFYGWPYAYFGPHEDPRMKGVRPDLVKKTLVPDVALGSHTSCLGLAFYTADKFPEKYRGGAFVGQRGSWNRSQFSGYKVVFVPFKDGKPAGPPEDFLTGFVASENEVYGRPVGVAMAADGSLLVADEPANIIWRVSANQ